MALYEDGDGSAARPAVPRSHSRAEKDTAPTLAHRIASDKEVFVNNEFHMADVDVIGFDYDYTLAGYNEHLPVLVYDLARDHLVSKFGYPSDFQTSTYDPNFAIRGLAVDRRTGVVMKVSSFNAITPGTVYRGRKRLSQEEVMELYHDSNHVSVEYRDTNMHGLNDLFSLPHACVLADIVEFFESRDIQYDPVSVADDVYRAIEHVHRSGLMHSHVRGAVEAFIETDPKLPQLIERFRDDGKQLFLLTNSGFSYVNAGLTLLLGEHWRQYFNVIIVEASKPAFYHKVNRPFRELDVKRGRLNWPRVTKLRHGHVYAHGNVEDMLKMAGWERRHVLYFGDSMFSDWREPRRAHAWTTGGIIRELGEYVQTLQSPIVVDADRRLRAVTAMLRGAQFLDPRDHTDAEEVYTLCEWVTTLDSFLNPRSSNPVRSWSRGGREEAEASLARKHDRRAVPKELSEAEAWNLMPLSKARLMDALEGERQFQRLRIARCHNENFGSLFESTNSPSLFAFSLMRYVDVYTSHVANFLEYPANHRFYPHEKLLPHQHRHGTGPE